MLPGRSLADNLPDLSARSDLRLAECSLEQSARDRVERFHVDALAHILSARYVMSAR